MLYPELALLRHHHRDRRARARHDKSAADAIVVRAFDRLYALEAQLIGADPRDLAGCERNVALDGEGLHRGKGNDRNPQSHVRDRHPEDGARQRQAAPPTIQRIHQRGQEDPDA